MKNLLVVQSGGPTAVINSSLAGVIKGGFERSDKVGQVFGGLFGIEGVEQEKIVSLEKFREDGLLDLLQQTPSSYLGSCRKKLPDPQEDKIFFEKIFRILEKNDIGYFFCIGGNDSMDTVDKMSRYAKEIGSEIVVVGVPKTIDNDLNLTDHTPGFGSAAKFISNSMRQLKKDTAVYQMPSVVILEAMGRNAGWLAASAALANDSSMKACDVICLPEIAFDAEKFLERVEITAKEQGSVMVCASEGIRDKEGKYITEKEGVLKRKNDTFGHATLGGVGQTLRDLVAGNLGFKTRSIELGPLQRCWSSGASLCDITEAFQAGRMAVEYACQGIGGVVPGFKRLSDEPYKMEIVPYDVREIANIEKKIPGSMITPDGFGVTEEFIKYARPLTCGEPELKYENGQLQFAPKVW